MAMLDRIERVAMRKWDVLQDRHEEADTAMQALTRLVLIAAPGTRPSDAIQAVKAMLAKHVGTQARGRVQPAPDRM